MKKYLDEISIALVKLALKEDFGYRQEDVTTKACIASDFKARAIIVAKQDAVIFGQQVAEEVFALLDQSISYRVRIGDGSEAVSGDVIAEIQGPFGGILSGERTALNFLQRLSAVCTTTKKVVQAIEPYKTQILDTRKTTPGFRQLEKAAVLAGGGTNHRLGLFDEFLIKNNHIDALGGSVTQAITRCRNYNPVLKLKVEVRDQNEIDLALALFPNGLLLDNFGVESLKLAVNRIRSNPLYKDVLLETSGGITIDNVKEYAATGVDQISLGFLTHSAKAVDLSLRFEGTEGC